MIEKSTRSNRYNSRRVATINNEPTKTQQQFKDDVNINKIMKKYHSTGQITHLNNRQGVFADLSTAQDFFDSVNTLKKAGEAFDQLPSAVRRKFNNDPGELLEFIHNPDNFEEGVKLGIFDPKQPKLTPQTETPQHHNYGAKTQNDELNDEIAKPTVKTKKPQN